MVTNQPETFTHLSPEGLKFLLCGVDRERFQLLRVFGVRACVQVDSGDRSERGDRVNCRGRCVGSLVNPLICSLSHAGTPANYLVRLVIVLTRTLSVFPFANFARWQLTFFENRKFGSVSSNEGLLRQSGKS